MYTHVAREIKYIHALLTNNKVRTLNTVYTSWLVLLLLTCRNFIISAELIKVTEMALQLSFSVNVCQTRLPW